MRDDRERLLDMLEAIQKIEQYVNTGNLNVPVENSELVEIWIIHHLQILGEAASRISDSFRAQHPEVAWGGMIGMRHVLVHGYFETDTEIISKVVQRDLPLLKIQLQKILNEK